MAVRWQYEHRLLTVLFIANFSQLGVRILVSPLVPDIMDSFKITKGTIGLTLTLMWFAYALFQFPSGLLGERYGERTVIVLSIFLTAVCTGLLAFAPTFLVFTALVVCLGMAAGLYFPVATVTLTHRFQDTGRALGIHAASGGFAGLVAPIGAAIVLLRYGWREAFLVAAGGVLFVCVLVFAGVNRADRSEAEASVPNRVRLSRIAGRLRTPSIAYTLLLAVIGTFSFQAFGSFFPTFLREYQGLSPASASLAFASVYIVITVGIPIAGALSDRLSRDIVIAGCFCSLGVAFLLAVSSTPFVASTLAAGLFGVGLSWPGVIESRFMDHIRTSDRNAVFGLVRTIYLAISSSGSIIVGGLADGFGWPIAFGVPAVIVFLALAVLALNKVARLGL